MDKVGSSWELSAGRSSLWARQGKHELKFEMHEILFMLEFKPASKTDSRDVLFHYNKTIIDGGVASQ